METSARNALVLWTFLQADSTNPEYCEELRSLVKGGDGRWDVLSQGRAELESDGLLESDGHLHSNISLLVQDVGPIVDVQLPVNPEEAAAVQRVAADLREIADQFEHDMVANATQRLIGHLKTSAIDRWRGFLKQEVEIMLRQEMGLQHLQQEQIIMALTFTLVKRVCEQAPAFLRGLCNSALEYIMPRNTR